MIILTHIGQTLPFYLSDFLSQLRKFNNMEVVFLTNQINCENSLFVHYNVKTFPIEQLINDRINHFINIFGYGNFNTVHKEIIYGSPDYWCVTAARLFFIYEYAVKNGVTNFFHFENDIMIYEDLSKVYDVIKKNGLYKNQISITRGTSNKIMTGFMYVDNVNVFKHMLDEIITYLDEKIDLFSFGIDHLNEMGLLHIYQVKNPDKLINLPIIPNSDLSNEFKYFNSVFDPATYGQFIDGTPGNPGVSILPDSIIKSEFNNQTINISFDIVDGFKIPYILFSNVKYKINSLHIHSKRLNLFLS